MSQSGLKKLVRILYCPGTNCEQETAAAFELAGARTELLFLADLLKGKTRITDCDIFCIPGGFSWGDYIKEGIITATMIADQLQELVEAKIPGLFICNGFQIAARARIFGSNMTLTRNVSDVFCSRPILHRVISSNCIWTRGLTDDILSFPSAHGGGLVCSWGTINTVMTYEGISPNGGLIAAVSSENGLLLGLMDHPERPYGNRDGQMIFKNGFLAV